MAKGKLVKEYWISCGLCGSEKVLDVPPKFTGKEAARQANYHLTQKHGWLCPECYAQPKQ